MSLVVSIYYVLLLLFINNGYCGSLEKALGQNKEINNGVINRLLSKSNKRKLLSGADIGYPCVIHEDCAGYGLGLNDMSCCDGICEQKSMGFCPPHQQVIRQLLNEECNINDDCEGSGSGPYDMACCDGTCQQKQTPWFSDNWGVCPDECKAGHLFQECPAGTCGTEETKLENEECLCHEQCQGYESGETICCEGICQQNPNRTSGESCSCPGKCSSGCCENGKCVSKQMDWVGLYWCPAEKCRLGWNCPIGSCIKRDIGEECLCDGHCKGYGSNIGCCGGICQQKQTNWEGVYVCPAKCVAAKGCKTGTCPGGRSIGESCSCRGQCLSGCCEGGECVSKQRDYYEHYFCPAECKGCLLCSYGSC